MSELETKTVTLEHKLKAALKTPLPSPSPPPPQSSSLATPAETAAHEAGGEGDAEAYADAVAELNAAKAELHATKERSQELEKSHAELDAAKAEVHAAKELVQAMKKYGQELETSHAEETAALVTEHQVRSQPQIWPHVRGIVAAATCGHHRRGRRSAVGERTHILTHMSIRMPIRMPTHQYSPRSRLEWSSRRRRWATYDKSTRARWPRRWLRRRRSCAKSTLPRSRTRNASTERKRRRRRWP